MGIEEVKGYTWTKVAQETIDKAYKRVAK